MSYQFRAVHAPTYVHAIGTGDHTAANLRRFLAEAYYAARDGKSDRLLLELNFSGPSLDLASIYSIIVDGSPEGSRLERIAYVDLNTGHSPDRAEFAELAANQLHMNVRLFGDVAQAEQWLQDGDDGSPARRARAGNEE